jgi:tetratricopeptide (TPR) repeat protein
MFKPMKRKILTIFISLIITGIPSSFLFSQDENVNPGGDGSRYGSDSVSCIMNISLYREFFKQWKSSDYKNETIHDLIPPWRWVLLNCPKGTQNTYIDGVRIMSYLIESTQDPALKNKYIDTLMMVYDQRIKYFGKEGYVLGRKGVDLFTFRPQDTKQIYDDLKRSVELEGDNTAGPVLIYYMKTAVNMAIEDKADSAIIFDTYDISTQIIDHNIKKNENNAAEKDNWIVIQNNIEIILEPFASCKDLVTIYRKKFTENPDDLELLRKINNILDEKKCQDDPLYFETTKRLYELEPSPASAYLIGKMLLNEGKYAEAIDYLKEAEKLNDTNSIQRAFMYIAQAYHALNNLPAARTYALKAAALNPTDGQPYMLIGDMYAESAKDCGDNELTSRVAFWVAVDKYYKARQVDPALAGEADKKIATYSMYFPTASTIFFYTLKEGDTYRVECWINEDTRVRAAKQ